MTRQEILAVARPILFNTEMVRAILGGRKTATRRIIKQNIKAILHSQARADHPELSDKHFIRRLCSAPYQPDDYLYVRETWAFDTGDTADDVGTGYFIYKADEQCSALHRWHPSIHMPKEAARLFLRVTEVRAERIQDITDKQIENEGIRVWSKDGKLFKYAPADHEGGRTCMAVDRMPTHSQICREAALGQHHQTR